MQTGLHSGSQAMQHNYCIVEPYTMMLNNIRFYYLRVGRKELTDEL
jgi:hypothetical protein